MSLTHNITQRTAFADTVGSAVGNAGLCVLKAGGTEVATITLNSPSFGAASGADIVLNNSPVPEDSAATGNAAVVDSVEFQNSGATVVFTGSQITGVGGGGDLELTKNPISTGDTVQLTSFTYTASP